MTNFRQFCAAVTLMLVLTFSAFAGDIQLPGQTVTFAGDTQTPGVTAAGEILTPGATADPLTEMALGFLLNLSSLL
jgi:hypothetical protein